jgi:hypothetical protein
MLIHILSMGFLAGDTQELQIFMTEASGASAKHTLSLPRNEIANTARLAQLKHFCEEHNLSSLSCNAVRAGGSLAALRLRRHGSRVCIFS